MADFDLKDLKDLKNLKDADPIVIIVIVIVIIQKIIQKGENKVVVAGNNNEVQIPNEAGPGSNIQV